MCYLENAQAFWLKSVLLAVLLARVRSPLLQHLVTGLNPQVLSMRFDFNVLAHKL